MKLIELMTHQSIIVQLMWGEKKIEFYSNVIDNDGASVYITPYMHNDSVLEINITQDTFVVCNIFTDEPVTKKRISWKNVELTTVNRNNRVVYCLKTYGFNSISNHDDRRIHERISVQLVGQLFDDEHDTGINITLRDISDIGISFYAPVSYEPNAQQMFVTFTDTIGEKEFNVKVQCSVSRVNQSGCNNLIGCKIIGENKDYLLYGFMKRLLEKQTNAPE